MNINAISNVSFNGFYKVDQECMGDNTVEFFAKNYQNIKMALDNYSNDLFIYVPKNKEKTFEKSLKMDKGRYWKTRPLNELLDLRGYNIFSAVFKADKGISGGYENWVV